MANRYIWDYSGGPDTDGDGLTDDFEVAVLGTDPRKWDTDGDGLSDLREKDFGANPLEKDTDGDGVDDGREVTVGTNPAHWDTDGDGIDDRTEGIQGTAYAPDHDGDGVPDWVEQAQDGDDDNDGLTNGEELWLRTNRYSDNTDGDDLPDLEEIQFGVARGRHPRRIDGPPADGRDYHVPSLDGPVREPAMQGPGGPPVQPVLGPLMGTPNPIVGPAAADPDPLAAADDAVAPDDTDPINPGPLAAASDPVEAGPVDEPSLGWDVMAADETYSAPEPNLDGASVGGDVSMTGDEFAVGGSYASENTYATDEGYTDAGYADDSADETF